MGEREREKEREIERERKRERERVCECVSHLYTMLDLTVIIYYRTTT